LGNEPNMMVFTTISRFQLITKRDDGVGDEDNPRK
jgi:hypothetical protein